MDKALEVLTSEAQSLRKRLAAVEGSIRLLRGSSGATSASSKSAPAAPAAKTASAKPTKRQLSAATRAKLSAAAKKRWHGKAKGAASP
jgi:hypothetical protein